MEERIKKALGNDLNTLIMDINEKLHELDGDYKEIKWSMVASVLA